MEARRWTEDEIAYLRKFWTGPFAKTAKQIGIDLGINQLRVTAKAQGLGLVREKLFLSEIRSAARRKPGYVARRNKRIERESLEDRPIRAGKWPEDAPRFTDHPNAASDATTPRRLYGDSAFGMRSSPLAYAVGEHA